MCSVCLRAQDTADVNHISSQLTFRGIELILRLLADNTTKTEGALVMRNDPKLLE